MKINRIIAVIVFAAATAAIWMWPKAKSPAPAEMPTRPVRSMVVEDGAAVPETRFSGIVKARAKRTLSFKESGRIASIPVSNGQKVRKDELLAQLYDGDFTNRVETCRAAAERDRISYRRISEAAKHNAVSGEEVSKAESQLRQSEAQLALAERALRATIIYAPFDCVVAKTIATELDVVNGVDPIVEVLDLSEIRIDVPVPESIVLLQKQVEVSESLKCYAVLDSLPSRRFEVEFVEFTASADELTQTFTATYRMKTRPDDLLVLPGMSATIIVPAGFCRYAVPAGGSPVSIPERAVGVDGQGGYFVWKLEGTENGVYVAKKQPVGDCVLEGGRMTVGKGLAVGDRIATAGIAVLTEGRKVTLLK